LENLNGLLALMMPAKQKTDMNIPKTHYGKLQGFLEKLDDAGSKSDLAGIALKQGLELDDLLPIVEAGEMLGLLRVESGDVSLTDKGHLFIAASPRVKKKMLREMVLGLDAFKKFTDAVKKSGKRDLSKDELLDFVASENSTAGSSSDGDAMNDFGWFIEWGRHGLVLKYDANNETISLREKL
jgi:NitT/TauT family transport system ATP-binding protein